MSLVSINVKTRRVYHRDFVIQKVWTSETGSVWEWVHKDYLETKVDGFSPSLFEAIEAVDAWYERETA